MIGTREPQPTERAAVRAIGENSQLPKYHSTSDLEVEQRARWEAAGRELDDARRHVAVAVGTLYRIVPARLGDPDEWILRWARDAFADLLRLDLDNELPAGGR